MDISEVDPAALSARDAIRSLRSPICPACVGEKKPYKTLCGGCYHALPRNVARALYQRVGEGYEQAVAAAFRSLNCTRFVTPQEQRQ